LGCGLISVSFFLVGHKSRVAFYNYFGDGLRDLFAAKKTTVSILVGQIDRERDNCNLSSAIRVYVFNHFRQRDRL
jgi:predicted DNA-binding ribbon-helix-helix protein